jgi:hypothetical protein
MSTNFSRRLVIPLDYLGDWKWHTKLTSFKINLLVLIYFSKKSFMETSIWIEQATYF